MRENAIIKSEAGEEPHEISRRGFLKLGAFLLMGAAASRVKGLEKLAGTHEAKDARKTSEAHIWNSVWEQENEQFFVGSLVDGAWVFTHEGAVGNTGGVENIDEAEKDFDPRATKLRAIHTHPAALYNSYFQKGYDRATLKDMRKGKVRSAPMPPSLLDASGAISWEKDAPKGRPPVETVVYEPSGMWELSVDKEAPFIKSLIGFERDIAEGMKTIFVSEEERAAFLEMGKGKDPRDLINDMDKDPRTKNTAVKLKEFLGTLTVKYPLMGTEYNRLSQRVLDLTQDAMDEDEEDKDVKDDIESFIKDMKEHGILMVYTPRER